MGVGLLCTFAMASGKAFVVFAFFWVSFVYSSVGGFILMGFGLHLLALLVLVAGSFDSSLSTRLTLRSGTRRGFLACLAAVGTVR